MTGTLVLCATPIGNLGDAPPRLAEALRDADVVYAEDTRRSRTLATHLGVDVRMRSFFAGNEVERALEIEDHLRDGATVVLVTDAGTPALADPGYLAVRAAIECDAEVSVVPGPSAVTAALAVAGLPAERFTFEGFLPRKGKARRERMEALAARHETTVFFAAPSRVGADLADMAELAPGRPIVVARELTKMHEEVWRGSVEEAVEHFSEPPHGELTIVVAGTPPSEPDLGDGVFRVEEAVASGVKFAAAVREVAAETGLSRRALYEAALRRR